MKHLLFVLCVAGTAGLAFAETTTTWTGGGANTDWTTPENWSDGVPTKDDIAIFDPGNGQTATVTLSCTGTAAVPLGGARFLSGTININQASGGDTKPGIVLAGCDGSTTSVVEVAAGVVVNMQKGFRAPQVANPGNSTPGIYTLRKTGAGTINTTGMFGHYDNGAGYFLAVDITAGAMTFSANSRQTDYVVRSGALMHFKTANVFSNNYRSLFVEVEEGGEFRYASTVNAANFVGAGNFTAHDKSNASVTFSLNRGGPKLLSGRLGLGLDGTNMTVTVNAQGTNADNDYQMVIGSSNTMAGVTRCEFNSEAAGRATVNHPFKFAPGVGSFWFDALGWKQDAPLVLEDTDGDPVDVYVSRHAIASSAYPIGTFFRFGVTGAGNYYVTGSQVFTNDVFFNTGTIGAAGSGAMTLGTGAAGKDVDLSRVGGTVAKDANSSLTYKNAGALVQPGTLGGEGTVTFNGPGSVRIAGRTTGKPKMTAKAATALDALATEGGTLSASAATTFGVAPGTETVLDALTVSAGGSVTQTNGVVRGLYGENSQQGTKSSRFNRWVPMGVVLRQDNNGMPFRVENGSFRVAWTSFGSGNRFYEVEAGPNGTLYQNGYVWPKAAAGTTPFVLLDGGTYVPSEAQSYNSSYTYPSSHDVWQIRVSGRGGRIAYDKVEAFAAPDPASSSYIMTMNAEFVDASGAEAAGPLALNLPGVTHTSRPVGCGGPLTLENGFLTFHDTEANRTAFAAGTLLGADNLALGLGGLSVGAFATAATGKIPQTVAYSSAAMLCGRESTKNCSAQTVELGTASQPIFERLGKGAALALLDLGTTTDSGLDGTGARFLAKGTVSTDKNGILTDPVFGVARTSSSNVSQYRVDFLTVDADDDNVLKKAATDQYAADFSEDADAIVRVDEAKTVSEDAAAAGLLVDKTTLALEPGVTLRLGGAADATARIALNNAAKTGAAIAGSDATLDLGASECVIATSSMSPTDQRNRIDCKIVGTGGLTVFAPEHGHQHGGFELNGANEYSGGTWLNGTELKVYSNVGKAFGTGTVHLDGGAFGGGRLRFVSAGTLPNALELCGVGPYTVGSGDMELGCLVFNADVTLTGAVNIRNFARVSNSILGQASRKGFGYQPGTGVFAGPISGGCLRVETDNPAEYERKPIVLAAANSYTGGTYVAGTVLTLRDAGTAGTGFVNLCNKAVLRFEKSADYVFANELSGFGTVQVEGAGAIDFTNIDGSGATEIGLDLAGGKSVWKKTPPFGTIANSAAKPATMTIAADMTFSPSAYAELTQNFNLVVENGVTVTVPAGETLTVRRLTCVGTGSVVGNVVETHPVRGMVIYVY